MKGYYEALLYFPSDFRVAYAANISACKQAAVESVHVFLVTLARRILVSTAEQFSSSFFFFQETIYRKEAFVFRLVSIAFAQYHLTI